MAAIALLGSLFAGSAMASRFEARLDELAGLVEREGAGPRLRQVAETPALADLETSLPGSLQAADRRLLRLVVLLRSPRLSHIHQKIASHKGLTAADGRYLDRIGRQLARDPAIAELRSRGSRLKRDPKELKSLWRGLVDPHRPPADLESTPNQTPLEAVVSALNRPIPALGSRSIAATGMALLASPAGLQYLRSLPPVALGMLLSEGTRRTSSAHSSSLCASGSIGPSVKTMLTFTANQILGDTVADATQKHVGRAVYWDAAFGTRALAWRTFTAVNALKAVYESIDTGKNLAEAAWNAVVKCGAESVKIVPEKANRIAGEPQSYSLLAKDRKGKEWGGIRIDALRMSGGTCNFRIEECYGEIKGEQSVVAKYGSLHAIGRFTVRPGPIGRLQLDPGSSTIRLGEKSPSYHVYATDRFGNFVTNQFSADPGGVHLGIFPDGSCDQATGTCMPQKVGEHSVEVETNSSPRVISAVPLHVRGNALDLLPGSATIRTGESQGYAAEEVALDGTPIRSVEFGSGADRAMLAISPDGSCDQEAATCAPAKAGPHLVTATLADVTGEASLEVEPRELEITPTSLEAAVPTRFYQEVLEVPEAEGDVEWQISGSPPNGIDFFTSREIGTENPELGLFPVDAAVLTGVPLNLGKGEFTVTAHDSAGNYAGRTLVLNSKAPACAGTCAEAGPREQVTIAWLECHCGIGAGNYYYLQPIINGVALEQYIQEWQYGGFLFAGPEGRAWASFTRGLTGHAGTHVAMKIFYGVGPPDLEGSTWEEFLESLHPLGTTNSVTVRH